MTVQLMESSDCPPPMHPILHTTLVLELFTPPGQAGVFFVPAAPSTMTGMLVGAQCLFTG